MLKLNDAEEQVIICELRRMRNMLLQCNETVHSGTDAEIKAYYVYWKSRWGDSPYYDSEDVSSLRHLSYARQAGSGQAAINMGLEYIEKIFSIIKESRENQEDKNND